LQPDDAVFSVWFHDETTANENDDGGFSLESTSKGSAIKKGEGRTVHVSDIIGVDRRALPADCQVTKTANDSRTAAVIMTVGVNQDGYWTCDRMCQQIPALIAIHELTSEPHRPGVFVFDNSTGHGAFEEGALLANHIQLKPG
ncbi:unnamed protein product, partial [Hapterophycus canaliculatus]